MGRLFGTDGVRGVANTELTCELAFKLGKAGAYVLSGEKAHKPRILVGKDTRRSGDMLESALVAGICSAGAQVYLAGVIPTPAVACLVRKHGFDAGIVISASHNPAEFNGIKFFNSEGYKLPDETEERIERIILDQAEEIPNPVGDQVGSVHILKTAVEDYVSYAVQTIQTDLSGLKIALDCANGAASVTSPMAISRLGAETLVINNTPDGMNINKDCGSTHLDMLKKFTVENKCHLGLAFDGDADRVLAVDETGRLVDGDHMMAIIGLDMKKKGMLAHNTIVATVMSNMGFDEMARNNGLNIVKAPVGDRYVLEKMLEGGFVLGGEQSGHVIMTRYNTTGDGLLTAIMLLSVLKESGKSLSELNAIMKDYPQVLRNARVSNAKKYSYRDDPVIAEHCSRLEEAFKGEGRVLIRPSGTEPLVRVMIEGKDQDYITQKAEELVRIIEKRLG
ncbi:MAG TPA: phosphoglucosamine mutase [Thermoclostridium caenicola]|uniref:phosphoglucosamine mutase n=1 Tax=Thermoclostridium caenicola TaxID=659425 RepID=UPI002C2DE65A|nr:phosphoglucosamine mutase [Thermoclostridium caenicola]HOL84547.1 phosphoglucosamine mutase [Thermoclostridium caenicola]HOP72848.1 phosphoglucosamine mutase [Thermoclostridium caenicola]HPO76536.1 phosphoglucosamine mutase [Thermoclostridium caenicola]